MADIKTCQTSTPHEHIVHGRHVSRVEVGDVEARQRPTTIEHLTHVRDVLSVETAQVEICQVKAITKHQLHVSNLGSVEAAHIQARQASTTIEHTFHVRHIRSVETGYIKVCQSTASPEHRFHIGNLFRVEMAQVEARQHSTSGEHIFHVSHILRVQILNSYDGLQMLEPSKPISCVGNGRTIGKRIVKDNRCLGLVTRPIAVGSRRKRINTQTTALFFLRVIVERQGVICQYSVWLRLSNHWRILVREVAGIRDTAIDMGISIVGMVSIIYSTHAAN